MFSELQWKVRYTLAACLHAIAKILGPELSERDLIPFYNALMKDLDEVRIGLLKHLAGFFEVCKTTFCNNALYLY